MRSGPTWFGCAILAPLAFVVASAALAGRPLPILAAAIPLLAPLAARLGSVEHRGLESPMRDVLAHARELGQPGGRLIVGGELRFGILFYSRRGHDPGIPLLLVPEDVAPEHLATVLRERLQVREGQEHRTPTILFAPPPETVPPGFRLVTDSATDPLIARLELRPPTDR